MENKTSWLKGEKIAVQDLKEGMTLICGRCHAVLSVDKYGNTEYHEAARGPDNAPCGRGSDFTLARDFTSMEQLLAKAHVPQFTEEMRAFTFAYWNVRLWIKGCSTPLANIASDQADLTSKQLYGYLIGVKELPITDKEAYFTIKEWIQRNNKRDIAAFEVTNRNTKNGTVAYYDWP